MGAAQGPSRLTSHVSRKPIQRNQILAKTLRPDALTHHSPPAYRQAGSPLTIWLPPQPAVTYGVNIAKSSISNVCNLISRGAGLKINFCPYLHPSFAGALGACYRAYVVNPAIRALAKTSQSGGIGRRARLKIVYLRMCGFDSHLWYK